MAKAFVYLFFIEFSGLMLFSKWPLLYAGASDILKRCLRLVIFSVFFTKNVSNSIL